MAVAVFYKGKTVFVIQQKSSYTWPVTVEFPVDGGKTDKQTFDAEFKRVPASRIAEIREAIEFGKTSDIELAREVMVGWDGIVDGNNEAVAFTERNRDQLLDVPLVSGAIVLAWLNSLSGAKRKN